MSLKLDSTVHMKHRYAYTLIAANRSESGLQEMKRFTFQALGMLLGLFAMISGELDDSPGLQGIGLIFIFIVFFSVFKVVKK